jgi:hypothetical protein
MHKKHLERLDLILQNWIEDLTFFRPLKKERTKFGLRKAQAEARLRIRL